MNKEINSFSFERSSNLDYEKIVIYINYFNDQVAILSCEKGMEKAKIELLDKYEDKIIWTFDYADFIEALKYAYEKLKDAND
jgi:hypothetical protein